MKATDEKERNRLIFEEMPVGKALKEMAVPMIISQLILLIYNIADVYYIGRTNNPGMIAGASLILPVYNVCFVFSNIASTGGGTLIARLLGVSKEDEARRVSTFSILFSVVSSFVFAAATYFLMDDLLFALGASDATFQYAKQYATCVIVIGAVPTIMGMTLGNLLRNAGYSKIAGYGFSMGGILNIILDPIFMFVILPEGSETLGAGIATMISNVATCLLFVAVMIKSRSEIICLRPKEGLPSKDSMKAFFTVGIPAAIGPFLFDLDYIIIDKLMAAYSDTALAAIGIVLKAERFPTNIGVGLCLGMVPIAAYNYSSGNIERMTAVVKKARYTGMIIGFSAIALYEIFAPQIMEFFIEDPSTVELGTGFLRARSLATVFMFLSFIYVNYFQGVGKGVRALQLMLLRWACLNIPLLFIMNALFGINGVVWAQFTGDVITSVISQAVYMQFSKTLSAEVTQVNNIM